MQNLDETLGSAEHKQIRSGRNNVMGRTDDYEFYEGETGQERWWWHTYGFHHEAR